METIRLSDLPLYDIGSKYQLAGAIYASVNEWLLVLFPHEQAHTEHLSLLPMTLAEWETFLRQTDLLETEVLLTDLSGKLAKVILRKSQRQIDAHVQWAVFRRDGYACRYCGRDDVPLTVDHIILWERGGPTIPDNLLACCKRCNRDRGSTEYPDWLGSPHYRTRSAALPEAVRQQNRDVLNYLPDLMTKRVTTIRSR